MKKSQGYIELIGKGVDNYISILKDNDLIDEVIERIKRKAFTFGQIEKKLMPFIYPADVGLIHK